MSSQFPNIVHLSSEKKCYICGRTPAQYCELFPADIIKSAAKTALEKQNTEIFSHIQTYLAQLKEIYQSTQGYRPDLTRKELEANQTITEKIAPRFRELLHFMPLPPAPPEFHYVSFIPLPKIESDWIIAHLRENLASIIRSLEQENYSSLARINPDLYEQTQKIVDIKLEDFKNDKTSFSCHQITRYYDLQGRDVLLKFTSVHDSEGYHSHYECYHLQEYNTYQMQWQKYRNSSREIQEKLIPKLVELPLTSVFGVDFSFYLCPICTQLFQDASKAAYGEIHEDDDAGLDD